MVKSLFLAIGILLWLLVAWVSFREPEFAAPGDDFDSATLSLLSVITTPLESPRAEVTYEQREERRLVFDIDYRDEIRRNETPVVSVTVDAFVEVMKIELPSGKTHSYPLTEAKIPLARDSTLKLSSTGISIGPEAITKPAGTFFPTTYAWTMTPIEEGTHALLLDFSDFDGSSQAGEVKSTALVVNSEEREELLSDGFLQLEVAVLTVWGVGKRTFDLGRAALALIGFVLMYPAVTEWLKRLSSAGSR